MNAVKFASLAVQGRNVYGLDGNVDAAYTSLNDTANSTAASTVGVCDGRQAKSTLESVVICVIVTFLIIGTVGGNILVLISFRINKQLQTVNNYFLLSLAVADLSIGLISMPLYTLYLVLGQWPLGPYICDAWLSIDYTMSNASVANLLVISFDRYLSVTRPLTYRANRTPRKAGIMIACVWVISFFLWTPWIFAWPYLEGSRTVPECDCAIQFLTTNAYMSVITIAIAFYVPVIIMSVLYYKVYLETRKRQKEMAYLQGNKRNTKMDKDEKKGTSKRDATSNSLKTPPTNSRRRASAVSSLGSLDLELRTTPTTFCQMLLQCLKVDTDVDKEEDSGTSDPSTNRSSVHVRCNTVIGTASLRTRPEKGPTKSYSDVPLTSLIPVNYSDRTPDNTPPRLRNLSECIDSSSNYSLDPMDSIKEETSSYTILIKLPGNGTDIVEAPSIKMLKNNNGRKNNHSGDNVTKIQFPTRPSTSHMTRSVSHDPGMVSRNRTSPGGATVSPHRSDSPRTCRRDNNRVVTKLQDHRIKIRRQEKKQDSKAAKTLTAILLAFIITWTPYSICTVIRAFCHDCVDETVYNIGYWLCYLNSTVNPMCYALCNANFRRAFWAILRCKCGKQRQRARPNVYRVVNNHVAQTNSDHL